MNQNVHSATAHHLAHRARRRLLAAAVGLASLVGTVAVVAPAQAASTTTQSTAEQPLDVPQPNQVDPFKGFNQGWWTADAGHDYEGYDNTNYSTGWSDYYGVTRSFFSFYMGRVKGTVTSATLQLPRGCANSQDVEELVKFWDVTTPAAALNRGTSAAESTFRDIGGGTEYGRTTISTSGGGDVVSVRLNAKAVAALNKAKGQRHFSVGAAVMSLNKANDSETVFGCTGTAPVSLVLTTR